MSFRGRGKRRRLTAQERAEICVAFANGEKLMSIGDRFEISHVTAAIVAADAGLPSRFETSKRQRIIAMSRENPDWSDRRIAALIDTHPAHVRKVRTECGLRFVGGAA